MFCSNCGQQLSDDANFCQKCGKPTTNSQEYTNEIRWESCEITTSIEKEGGVFKDAEMCFWAKALGPNGSYNAGESTLFPGEYNSVYSTYVVPWSQMGKKSIAAKALDELIDKLARDGWESTGMNDSFRWYKYTFKRKAKNKTSR